MPDRSELNVDDVIVSKVHDGHLLLIVTADPRRSIVPRVSRK
jgi:hypothetical protein